MHLPFVHIAPSLASALRPCTKLCLGADRALMTNDHRTASDNTQWPSRYTYCIITKSYTPTYFFDRDKKHYSKKPERMASHSASSNEGMCTGRWWGSSNNGPSSRISKARYGYVHLLWLLYYIRIVHIRLSCPDQDDKHIYRHTKSVVLRACYDGTSGAKKSNRNRTRLEIST